MNNNANCLDAIKNEIVLKRQELDRLVEKNINRDEILIFSQELDILINKYIKNVFIHSK